MLHCISAVLSWIQSAMCHVLAVVLGLRQGVRQAEQGAANKQDSHAEVTRRNQTESADAAQ